ncbi:MAG: hypothetical protein WC747_02390 [Candidatus Babeliales bacterium]|jgi:hypothetical protein
MKKNFIFTLITVLSVAGLVHAGKTDNNKKVHTTKVRKNARDLKFKLSDNPGQFGDTQHAIYYSYPIKAFSNK